MTVLMYADTVRQPDLRHVIAHPVADPFLYIEHEGAQRVVVRSLEMERMRAVAGLEVHSEEELGLDELRGRGESPARIPGLIAVEACRRFGVTRATVPAWFPLGLGDRLRESGIELEVDDELLTRRRRAKTPTQLEGIARAQRGAEAAVRAIAGMLAAADIDGTAVVLDGEPLTSERLKAAAREAFAAGGVVSVEFIVAHGYQTCVGHHMGSGAIGAGEPITVDLWPRDEETGCFTDMTRTFVVGDVDEELTTYHRLAREALERSIEVIRPGVAAADVHGAACAVFEAEGMATQRTKAPGEVLLDGFFHSLGHGVGLEVHEAPGLGLGSETLVEGDVLAVEPGCYRQGFGGVRLEDLVVVTADGAQRVTDFPYELSPRA